MQIKKIESKIILIREQKVILDSDVALLYGVETKIKNERIKNNPDKFPKGYIISLNKKEWDSMKTKFSTSLTGGKTKLPKAFTEKGLYMLATILKSEQATKTSIAIIETFAKVRELTQTINKLSQNPPKPEQQSLMQKSGEIMANLLDNDWQTTGTETSIEINFAVLKFKHTIKKGDK